MKKKRLKDGKFEEWIKERKELFLMKEKKEGKK